MNEQQKLAVQALNLIAAKAAHTATLLEGNRLWPGDLAKCIQEIEQSLPWIKAAEPRN